MFGLISHRCHSFLVLVIFTHGESVGQNQSTVVYFGIQVHFAMCCHGGDWCNRQEDTKIPQKQLVKPSCCILWSHYDMNTMSTSFSTVIPLVWLCLSRIQSHTGSQGHPLTSSVLMAWFCLYPDTHFPVSPSPATSIVSLSLPWKVQTYSLSSN